MTIEMMAGGEAAPLVCKGKKGHNATNTAWREGCRHPGAIEAHERWKAERDNPYTLRPAALDENGNCIAEKHHTRMAYIAGCRHPRAIMLQDKYMQCKAGFSRAHRNRLSAMESWYRARWASVVTGGRLHHDPRMRWRHGRMAVDRHNLWMLIHGFVDSPTKAEKMAAAIVLSTLRVSDGWYCASRPINHEEIGERIGSTSTTVKRLLTTERRKLAAERPLRRLADARWKAAVAAEAPDRKAREQARHGGVTRAQRRRQEWKQHCRTMRRLRESQERAKRIALAIERRDPPVG